MARPSRNTIIRLTTLLGVVALYYVVFLVFSHGERAQDGALWVGLLAFPLSIGAATQALWDPPAAQPKRVVFGVSCLVLLAFVCVLLAIQVETLICVVMALPIFLPLQVLGIVFARAALQVPPEGHDRSVQATLLGLPLVLAALGLSPTLPTSYETRHDSIVIDAPSDVIWGHILDFPDVGDHERLWTVSHAVLGAPQPIRSRVEGSVRPADWTMGVTYEERIVFMDAPRAMDWDIHFAPDFKMPGFDEHIGPSTKQMTLLDGGYVLTSLPEGGTRVDLHTRYRLRTGFNIYVALWGAQFLGDNHRAILHVLKLRSESQT